MTWNVDIKLYLFKNVLEIEFNILIEFNTTILGHISLLDA